MQVSLQLYILLKNVIARLVKMAAEYREVATVAYPSTEGNNLIVSPNGNYNYKVVQDYVFDSPILGQTFTIPEGFITDGASIPRIFWGVFGGPFCPKNLEASVQHDFLIYIGVDGSQRDLQFYSTLVDNNTDKWKARLMYIGVVVWRKVKTFLT